MGVKMKREDKMEKSDEKMESVTPPGEMRTGWYRDVQASMNGDSPMYGKSEGSIPQPSAMLRGNMVGAEPVVVMPGYPSAPGNPQAPSAFEMLIEQQKVSAPLQKTPPSPVSVMAYDIYLHTCLVSFAVESASAEGTFESPLRGGEVAGSTS